MILKNVVVDIGGTNFRFGVVDDANQNIVDLFVDKVANYESFSHALSAFISLKQITLGHLAVAIAGPIVSHYITMTNTNWAFDIDDITMEFDLLSLQVINDLSAITLAIPSLPKESILQIGAQLHNAQGAKAIVGVGTGLGVSALVPAHASWTAIESEGGHIHLSALSEIEQNVLSILRLEKEVVSAETLISGAGFIRIYNALAKIKGESVRKNSSSEITSLALRNKCPIALETLDIFSIILARFASDTALMMAARGGVYIGGGVTAKIIKCINHERFRKAFEYSESADYLQNVPTYLIADEYAGLKGVTTLLKGDYSYLGVKTTQYGT